MIMADYPLLRKRKFPGEFCQFTILWQGSSTLLYLVVTFLQNVSPFALQRQKIVLHLFMSPPLQFISSKDVFNCLSVRHRQSVSW